MVAISEFGRRDMLTAVQPVAVDESVLEFSFASTFPVERSGYREVLDLAGVDLSRVHEGAVPLLFNHREELVLGQVLAVWRSGSKLYCRAKLGDSDLVRRYGPDIISGVLPNVSCRYSVSDWKESTDFNGRSLVTLTNWTLLEISITPIAADPTVGIGRSIQYQQTTGAKAMPSAARIERERIRTIDAIANKWGPKLPGGLQQAQELRTQAEEEDLNESETRQLFCDHIMRSMPEPESISRPLPQSDGRPPMWAERGAILGLGEKDIQQYSITKLIAAVRTNNWSDAGLELECSRALQAKGLNGQNLIPMEALRVFNVQTSPTQAGNLVGTDHMGSAFIDALRARTFAYELGATKMPGLQGNVEIPRQTGVSSLGWVTEDANLPQTGPSFDNLLLKPKTVGAYCELTRMLSVQSDPMVEQLILRDFLASLAREIDRAAVVGNGTTEPRGILNTPGVSSVALGTNGGLPTWAQIVAMEGKISDLNADQGSVGYVVSTKLRTNLKTTLKSATAGSEFIWADSPTMNGQGMLNGYRALASTTVPSNLTKGTGTGLSAAIFGDWSSLVIGEWGALNLEINPYANFQSGRTAARIMMFCDMVVRHPESFCVVTDAITS